MVLGAYILALHLLRDVIVGDGAVARGNVFAPQDGLEDLLGKADAMDGARPRDGLSVRGHGHGIFGIADHTVDEDNSVGYVRIALDVVRDEVIVRRVDGVVHRRLGGGGRHLSDIFAFRLLGGLLGAGVGLPHEPGRHGGIVGVFGGSVVDGGVGVGVVGIGVGVVDVFAFVVGDFLFV
jgi:hypothetical protein